MTTLYINLINQLIIVFHFARYRNAGLHHLLKLRIDAGIGINIELIDCVPLRLQPHIVYISVIHLYQCSFFIANGTTYSHVIEETKKFLIAVLQ